MAITYTLISSYTVTSGSAASITLSSIPQTYTDLLVKYSLRCDNGSVEMWGTFNGNSSGIYSYKLLRSNPAVSVANDSGSSATYDKHYINWSSTTANTFGNGEMYIPDYTSSKQKSFFFDDVTENNSSDAWAQIHAGNFASTSAITSITFTANTGNFVQYSTAYLYGISNA